MENNLDEVVKKRMNKIAKKVDDELPEGYTCPVCKVDASHFHKI